MQKRNGEKRGKSLTLDDIWRVTAPEQRGKTGRIWTEITRNVGKFQEDFTLTEVLVILMEDALAQEQQSFFLLVTLSTFLRQRRRVHLPEFRKIHEKLAKADKEKKEQVVTFFLDLLRQKKLLND